MAYFGQPSFGRFFRKDVLIAAFQFPFILSLSGIGPRAGSPLARTGFFLADFISVSILCRFCFGVNKPFAFAVFNRGD
jgi:hypothetical protein